MCLVCFLSGWHEFFASSRSYDYGWLMVKLKMLVVFVCDLLSENPAHPHFKYLSLRPEIIIAMGCLVAKIQLEVHTAYVKLLR